MKRQYINSERAHFMCPNMHFGMLLKVKKEYEEKSVADTLQRMAMAHPFLRSMIAYEQESERLFYDAQEESCIDWCVQEDIATLWDDYAKFSEKDWNVFENGLLKVRIYPECRQMTVLFVAHHLLADGRGLLEIAEEFANDYVGGIWPVYVEEELIGGQEDLPAKSGLLGISKLLVKNANKRWAKEDHKVTYAQYQSFVEDYAKKHKVVYRTYLVERDEMSEMAKLCKENGFSVNDLLMAKMYLQTGTKKIIIAADIREKFAKYKKGALGNYSTAMGIECKVKTGDEVETAKLVHQTVQKHLNNNRTLMLVLSCYFEMSPTLLDAAAISALGGFESATAKFVGGAMFGFGTPHSYSITNLGKVENAHMESLMFIPPASPAAKLTVGVVTLNGSMHACSAGNVDENT